MATKVKIPTLAQWVKAGYGKAEDGAKLEGAALQEAFNAFVTKLEDEAADASEGDSELSYPGDKKSPHAKHLRAKWKEQGRVKCVHPKCFYPLNLVRDSATGELRKAMEVPDGHEAEGERAYVAECSWDPRHKHEDDSTQYILHSQLFPELEDEDPLL